MAKHSSQEPLEGGYDYDFVEEPPESLKCLICLLVARDPQQHGGCGKLFCKTCIDKYRRNDCPHCRQTIRIPQSQLLYGALTNTTMFNDFKSGREVKALMVFCGTKCGWKGPLEEVELHETKNCDNTEVSCPNACRTRVKRKNLKLHRTTKCPRRLLACSKCKEKVEFRNRTDHKMTKCIKRTYTCPNCNEAGVYDELITTHLTVCPKVIIECSKCSNQMLRCNKEIHTLVCRFEPVRCKYYNIGCEKKPLRQSLQIHEKNAHLHLSLAIEEILRLKNALYSKKTLTFRLIWSTLQNSITYSPPFFTSTTGYKICVAVYVTCQGGGSPEVSVFTYLMKGDHDDTLTWPFTGSVTFELLNQLEDKNHHKHTTTFPADDNDDKCGERVVDGKRAKLGWGKTKFISRAALDYNASTNTQYLKDDTLVFRVSAEAPDHKPWLECTSR